MSRQTPIYYQIGAVSSKSVCLALVDHETAAMVEKLGWDRKPLLLRQRLLHSPYSAIATSCNTVSRTRIKVPTAPQLQTRSSAFSGSAHRNALPFIKRTFAKTRKTARALCRINAMLPEAIRGTVTSIQLVKTIQPNRKPIHAMISLANAGILPKGLTISPNERWVATTNLERGR